MSIDEAFSHDCIILDACCIINLSASRQMKAVLKAIPRNLSVAAYVKNNEVLSIYTGPITNVQESSELIDLQAFIDEGLLILVNLEAEEQNTYINLAEKLDDGEAITGAIALSRNWAMATDDLASIKLIETKAPQIALVSTLDLMKCWADTNKPDESIVRDALLNIRMRGKYEPHRNHHLNEWWQKFR